MSDDIYQARRSIGALALELPSSVHEYVRDQFRPLLDELERLRAALPTAEEREVIEWARDIAALYAIDTYAYEPADAEIGERARAYLDRLLALGGGR